MAGYVRHVPIISDGHWVVVGCDLVDHGGILGVGAEGGQNYSEAPNGEGRDQNRFLGPGILEEGSESPRHLGFGDSAWREEVFITFSRVEIHAFIFRFFLF